MMSGPVKANHKIGADGAVEAGTGSAAPHRHGAPKYATRTMAFQPRDRNPKKKVQKAKVKYHSGTFPGRSGISGKSTGDGGKSAKVENVGMGRTHSSLSTHQDDGAINNGAYEKVSVRGPDSHSPPWLGNVTVSGSGTGAGGDYSGRPPSGTSSHNSENNQGNGNAGRGPISSPPAAGRFPSAEQSPSDLPRVGSTESGFPFHIRLGTDEAPTEEKRPITYSNDLVSVELLPSPDPNGTTTIRTADLQHLFQLLNLRPKSGVLEHISSAQTVSTQTSPKTESGKKKPRSRPGSGKFSVGSPPSRPVGQGLPFPLLGEPTDPLSPAEVEAARAQRPDLNLEYFLQDAAKPKKGTIKKRPEGGADVPEPASGGAPASTSDSDAAPAPQTQRQSRNQKFYSKIIGKKMPTPSRRRIGVGSGMGTGVGDGDEEIARIQHQSVRGDSERRRLYAPAPVPPPEDASPLASPAGSPEPTHFAVPAPTGVVPVPSLNLNSMGPPPALSPREHDGPSPERILSARLPTSSRSAFHDPISSRSSGNRSARSHISAKSNRSAFSPVSDGGAEEEEDSDSSQKSDL